MKPTMYVFNLFCDIDDFDIWPNVLYVSQVMLHYQQQNQFYL